MKGCSGKPPLLLMLETAPDMDMLEEAGVVAPALCSLLSKEAWLLEAGGLLLVSAPVPEIMPWL